MRDNGTLTTDGFTVTVNAGTATPKVIWETRKETAACVEESHQAWAAMTIVERDQVIRCTKTALARLSENVADWLPDSVKAKAGQIMEVSFCVLFTDAD